MLKGRIIPARAGFTHTYYLYREDDGDHPRSRGVYTTTITDRVLTAGIIPARAGFTRVVVHGGVPFGDHPRSRGVYWYCPPRAISV